MIRILQININHCRAAHDMLMQQIIEMKIGICIIAEPYIIPNNPTWAGSIDGKAAIVWIPAYVKVPGILLKQGQYSIALKWGDLTVVSCYISPNVDDTEFNDFLIEMEEMVLLAGSNTIIGGDFNSWSTMWGSTLTDTRGSKLSRWAATNDVRLINVGKKPTCVRPQGTSVVDLTWSTPDLGNKIKLWTILEHLTMSDHKYIYFEVYFTMYKGRNEAVASKKKYPRWSSRKLNEEMFKENLEWSCQENINDFNAEGVAKWLKETLSNACDHSMPRAKLYTKTSTYWWNNSIAEVRKQCNKARKNWQKKRSKRTVSHEEILIAETMYRDLKDKLRREINRSKANAWDELIAQIDSNPWGLPYKLVLNKLRHSSTSVTELMSKNILDNTIERLFPTDNEWEKDKANEWEAWNSDNKITIAEVHQVMRKRKINNTAPGRDGIKATIMKKVPDILIDKITDCLNICLREGKFPKDWKKAILILIPKGTLDLAEPKVRPICLLNEMGKILERVLASRMEAWMNNNPDSKLVNTQYGFRKMHSTYDALWQVQSFVNRAIEENAVVIGVSLDITNAFNTIRWQHIRKALREKGFPDYIRRIVDDYLSNRTIEFSTCEGVTRTRMVTSGVPQGSVLGPTLWNVTYDWVLQTPLEKGGIIIGYADDTLILVKAQDIAQAVHIANLQISRVMRRIKNLDLNVAENKTEVVLFTKRTRDIRDISIRIGHTNVRNQTYMKYLGLLLDERWSFKDHIMYIEDKTNKISRALGRLMPNLRGPGEKKRRLYANTITSVIIYGAPIWSEVINGSKKLQDRLKQIQRTTALRVIAGYRTVSADAALILSRMVPAMIHASYWRRVYTRARELKEEGEWNKKKELEIKNDERILMIRQWKIYLERPTIAGKRTCDAISPVVTRWLDREHGELTYRLTQIFTGHGCFNKFLYRIGKVESPICSQCDTEEDSSEHTLQTCPAWDLERDELKQTIGLDLHLPIVTYEILQSKEAWAALSRFAEVVMLRKETDERERQRRPRQRISPD